MGTSSCVSWAILNDPTRPEGEGGRGAAVKSAPPQDVRTKSPALPAPVEAAFPQQWISWCHPSGCDPPTPRDFYGIFGLGPSRAPR